jgi:hypothetical protein
MVNPVNPVDQMGDLIIQEGYNRPLQTDADKQRAFNEYLVEEVFLSDMFSAENSIFKPEKEDDEDTYFSGAGQLYGDLSKKQIARYLSDNQIDLVGLANTSQENLNTIKTDK